MKIVSLLILFAVIGLVVGYVIFGQINNKYVDPLQFIAPRSGVSGFLVTKLYGIEEKRKNILIAGAIGGVVGLFFGILAKKNKENSK